jgi:hypothetical protein
VWLSFLLCLWLALSESSRAGSWLAGHNLCTGSRHSALNSTWLSLLPPWSSDRFLCLRHPSAGGLQHWRRQRTHRLNTLAQLIFQALVGNPLLPRVCQLPPTSQKTWLSLPNHGLEASLFTGITSPMRGCLPSSLWLSSV